MSENVKQSNQAEGSDADLLAMAQALDNGEEFTPEPSAEQEADRAASSSETETAGDPDKDKPDNSVATKKPGDGTEAAKADKPEGQQTKEPSKFAKDRERLDKTWKGVEARKSELDRREQELAEREKQINERAKQAEKPVEQKDDHGFTASEYEAAAKQFREDGDDTRAEAAESRAKKLRESDASAAQEGERKAFLETWHGHVNETLEKRPELKDQAHELSQAVQKLLKEDQVFSFIPDGFKRAVEIADLRIQAASVPSLQAEVDRLKKEIDRLNGERQPGSSGPTSKPKQKTFDQLSKSEQEAELLRMAEQADREGTPLTV